ncbi:3'(2'),5'-bisphosphate nucleotidase CysQ [Plebeiibacterium sediminum]|uniref:3'(2'),5'-bisphosphate nucleotidase CysQ n=1 Tax=Plebeiibacterium sediminum TaxID=2992112 RepID=A0AAE3M3U4_9BACT|nr:3'(2'),5'-bisphosphate nucleotidase CysQ [Plebeiobacterium sediminum]MCW3786746.1 3'(2'),5'-bisphosphate nucleotidase CysQ [Plebeiobacterium sediminum]
MDKLLKVAIDASIEAGKAIMDIFENGDFGVEKKADNSPLTLADKAAHNIIEKCLLTTDLPILSEEGKHEDFEIRKGWNKLWIVDPLDGTKEFVKKTGEFTVNIALIENNYPVLGVVFVPATGVLYYGGTASSSYKVQLNDDWRVTDIKKLDIGNTQKLPLGKSGDVFRIVASVSHLSKETEEFTEILKDEYGKTDFMSVGSSIKICKVAEGSADVYPRLGPTMEWDTAAGQAVAEGAGMKFINWKTQARFDYNRQELLNAWFVVAGEKVSEEQLLMLISKSNF